MVFDKTMLRPHLVECFEKSLRPFPISKRQRVAQAIVAEQVCLVYCLCRLPEHQGSMMIQCNKCHEWYHSECINTDTLYYQQKLMKLMNGTVPAVTVNYTSCMLLNKYIANLCTSCLYNIATCYAVPQNGKIHAVYVCSY